jgi:hypothetical protein
MADHEETYDDCFNDPACRAAVRGMKRGRAPPVQRSVTRLQRNGHAIQGFVTDTVDDQMLRYNTDRPYNERSRTRTPM